MYSFFCPAYDVRFRLFRNAGRRAMSDDERDSMYIANCQACTVADALKVCHACRFNVGLAFRLVKQNEVLSADCLLRIEEIKERVLIFSS